MCSIQYLSFLIFLYFPVSISKAKLKNNGDKASSSFRPFWIGIASDKIFAYVDFTVDFIYTHFNYQN